MNSTQSEPNTSLEGKLFSADQVFGATFLGNAISGGILIAMNYFKLKENGKAWLTLGGSAILTVVVLLIVLNSPQGAPLILYVVQAFGFRCLARGLQGDAVDSHVSQGGKKGSGLATLGIALGGLILTAVVYLSLYFVFPNNFAPKVKVAEHLEVFYEDGASKEEAMKLGKALQNTGVFKNDGKNIYSFTISRNNGELGVLFRLKDGIWNDESFVEIYRQMGKQIAPAIGGPPIRIKLCDDNFIEKKVLIIDK